MKKEYELLYKEMMTDIERCLDLELPHEERIESAYQVTLDYWEQLKKKVRSKASPSNSPGSSSGQALSEGEGELCFFQSEAEEIDFFRNVKPLFTGYVEFFLILYEAILFLTENKERLIPYWEEETKRYKRFCDKNGEFINYYESDSHYMDSIYFLRSNNNSQNQTLFKPYDTDMEFCTSHDSIVSSLLANKMYFDFVNKRVKELRKSEVGSKG